MPTLGAPLDAAKYEVRNLRAHQLGAAPSSPVTGLLYYNTGDNTLYFYDGSQWVSTRGTTPPDATPSVKGVVQLAGDLGGTAAAPVIANGAVTSAKIADGTITDTDVAAANKDGGVGVPSLRSLGTGATQAAAGNDARFTDSRNPSGAAGGDLAGSSYPNPVIANGVVTSAKIADGTIVDGDVAAANKDGANGTPSLRTLNATPKAGTTPGQAMAASTTLEQIAPPQNPGVNMNGWQLYNLAAPTAATDAANKAYVDNAVQGLDAKQSVRAATTGNITLSGTQTVDGVAVAVNDRVLVKNQTTPSQNGPYTVQSGAWTRTTDADTWGELVSAFVFVEEGGQQESGWVCTVDAGGTLGTTAVTWTQFSGAGQITAGAGLTKSGNTLDAGAGPGIQVNADTIQVAPNGIDNSMIADGAINLGSADVTGTLPVAQGGTGSNTQAGSRTALGAAGYYNNNATHSAGTTIVIAQTTHGLRASRAIHVQVQDNATGNVEIPDISVAANGDVTITYGASVGANTKLVTLVG